jgi:acyl-CoA hydrolase
MPYGYGGARERIHISEIDHVIEGGDTPLFYSPVPEATDTDRKIAGHVLELLRDGDCIQLGIGGMPNALGKMINDTDLKDLGGHTGMLGEAYMDLMESGKINNMRKWYDRGKTIYTFASGSKDFFDWLDRNSSLSSYHVEYVNNPVLVSRIPNMVSINQALEADI